LNRRVLDGNFQLLNSIGVMASKLSRLQKSILINALGELQFLEHQSLQPEEIVDDLILVAPKDPWGQYVSHVYWESLLEWYLGFELRAKGLGDDRQRAISSLYRALHRLKARGYFVRRGPRASRRREAVWQLTKEGIAVAESLSA